MSKAIETYNLHKKSMLQESLNSLGVGEIPAE